ncbi:hypothetical protein [Kitasatospora sp. CB02891]|uniref:hypothetical protein n=1 Tax=Kitasatospora sp. CB02891 TaxID=2020329 RepID=UPI000C276CBC|nr:hypothetical protein [Kitasatospora sp. CB02891]PJN22426.1 hypothetical protein CG736_28345 [Kitasatospora sp. CB02891]
MPNPNWPLIEESWGPNWGAAGGNLPGVRWAEITRRVIGTTAAQRGRQYELDQVRAGEYRLTLDNTDGAFDPTNTAGPWYGRVVPYQPVRKRAQWPATINLLNQIQATGGDAGGQPLGPISGSATQIWSELDPTGGSIAASATAFRGARVLQFAVPAGAPVTATILFTAEPAAEGGTTYTMQARIRAVTSGTVQVRPYIGAYLIPGGSSTKTFGATVTLTGSPTAAWTQVTVTATLPAGVLGLACGVMPAAAPAAAITVQVDEWQLEKASAASAWVQPGTWYPIYAGFAERWPQTWTDPTRAVCTPTCVDTFALLSQVQLRDPLSQEILSRSPRFLYTLGDSQGATTFADTAGTNRPAPVNVSKYGPGTITSGTQITSASPGGAFTGSTGTVTSILNANPGTSLLSAASYISLSSAGITGPADPSAWTRMIAFRYTAGSTPSDGAIMWSSFESRRVNNNPGGSRMYWQIDTAARFGIAISGPGGSISVYSPSTANVADGNWHLAIASYSRASGYLIINFDGTNIYWPFAAANEPTGLISDNLGAYVDPTAGNGTIDTWQGDLAYVTEWPTALADTDMTTIYTAWKSAFAGDSTDTRYTRILNWAGYTGSTSIQAGLTRAMGPATGGTDALSALQDATATEAGTHYVDRAGTLTFRARSDRYNKLVSAYVFGDGPGEYPYEPGVAFDYDPTRLANIVTATRASTGQVFTAVDQPSITQYYPRTMSRSINTASALEVQDAANYLLSRYRQPALRITSLVLNPGANPALWPVCLSLELGMRVTVNRRTAAGNLISQPCFVENIQPAIAADSATWTLQLSPVDTTPYGVLAAFHTAVATTVAAGATSIIIKNPPGQNNTDPAAAQLPAGGQLILGLGTANQETVTILRVGSSTAGWTAVTVFFTAATTKAHTAGDVVCEALPAGATDPTAWDAVSRLDQHAYAY